MLCALFMQKEKFGILPYERSKGQGQQMHHIQRTDNTHNLLPLWPLAYLHI